MLFRSAGVLAVPRKEKNLLIWDFLQTTVCLDGVELPLLQFDQPDGVTDCPREPPGDVVLGDVPEDGQLKGVDGVLHMGGNEDDLHIGQNGPDFPGQLHPSAAGHFNVQQNQVKEKPILSDVVEKIVAVSVGGDLAGAPALLQAVFRDAPVGLDGGAVIVADGNTQHGVIHLLVVTNIFQYGTAHKLFYPTK